MSRAAEFAFSGGSVAKRYDEVLVPLVFEPWAEALVAALPPETGWDVLDLATGTGIVAGVIAGRLSGAGSLTALDPSPEMLSLARARLERLGCAARVELVEAPAHATGLPDGSLDAVYCQQGFQFFPDRDAAAAEMNRVLRPGGRVAVSTWCPLAECGFFGAIAACLREIGEDETAELMGVPFDHMPRDDLERHFTAAGFRGVAIERVTRELAFAGGPEQAYQAVHATPVAPRLAGLGGEKLGRFRELFLAGAERSTRDGVTTARLASLLLAARSGPGAAPA